jgi:ESCRT-I complex subunit TSG101
MSAGSIQPLMQELNGVYTDPTRVLQDASKLLHSEQGSELIPKILPVAERKGHVNEYHKRALCFTGCIPIVYQGGRYQIPIQLFLVPSYPSSPPICYVRALDTMVLKENHKHVGADGMIYMPYLHQWNNQCNLVDLVLNMVSQIKQKIPVKKNFCM